jgi:hypothetical protein
VTALTARSPEGSSSGGGRRFVTPGEPHVPCPRRPQAVGVRGGAGGDLVERRRTRRPVHLAVIICRGPVGTVVDPTSRGNRQIISAAGSTLNGIRPVCGCPSDRSADISPRFSGPFPPQWSILRALITAVFRVTFTALLYRTVGAPITGSTTL